MITYNLLGKNGRLGNQLFQLISTIGIAKKKGKSFSFPTWHYAPYLNVNPSWFSNEKGTEDLGDKFYQDYKHFDSLDEQSAHDIFKPSQIIEAEIEDLKKEYMPEDDVEYIMIGVRRTDYLSAPTFYPIPTLSYYSNAINFIKLKDPSKKYKVICFSDDINWCIENKLADIYYMNNHSIDIVKMFVFSKCDHFVIANSTFHWWGAYLSNKNKNKTIIYPVRWLGESVPDKETFDLFYPEWYGFSSKGHPVNYPNHMNVNIIDAISRKDL